MSNSLLYITALIYFISTLVFLTYLFVRKDALLSTARNLAAAGFAVHTVMEVSLWAETGRTPAGGLHESLALFSWTTMAIYMYLLFRYRQKVLGAFVTPFALLLLLTASILPRRIIPLSPVLESYWLPIHVLFALFGNGFFALAFFLGVMYVIQEHYLKTRRLTGLFFILPSLETLDELNYRCLQVGFPLLTLAIITGAVWSEYALGSYWDWKPRQIWSLITWFLYAALLHGRLTSGWRGKKAALFSGAAFMVLLASFIIINLALGAGHGFWN